MPLPAGFVDADRVHLAVVGFRPRLVDEPGDEPPEARVVLADESRCGKHGHMFYELEHHALEEEREPGLRARPWDTDAVHAVPAAFHSGEIGVQYGLVLEEIEMPPPELFCVVGLALLAAPVDGAWEGASLVEAEVDVQFHFLCAVDFLEFDFHDFPWLLEHQGHCEEHAVVHLLSPSLRIV